MFGRAGTEATMFEANKQALLEAIGTTGLRIAIDLRKNIEMEGAIGACAQVGAMATRLSLSMPTGSMQATSASSNSRPCCWRNTATSWIRASNPSLESAGDEGELFANLITNAGLNADQIAAINTENDWGTVQVDDRR